MAVVGSDVELSEEGEVQGASAFGSVIVVGVALRKKKWYYEVRMWRRSNTLHSFPFKIYAPA